MIELQTGDGKGDELRKCNDTGALMQFYSQVGKKHSVAYERNKALGLGLEHNLHGVYPSAIRGKSTYMQPEPAPMRTRIIERRDALEIWFVECTMNPFRRKAPPVRKCDMFESGKGLRECARGVRGEAGRCGKIQVERCYRGKVNSASQAL